MSNLRSYIRSLLPFIPLIGGIVSGLIRASDWKSWYGSLNKAPWNPPSWVFGPVWTILYLSMGWAYHLISERQSDIPKLGALSIFWIQLFLNFLWSPLFFGFKSPKIALLDILFLWGFIAWTHKTFKAINPTAGQLIWIYWAWVSYAATLNAYIVLAN